MGAKRVAVFASGNGSNFEAILANWQETGFEDGQVSLLVCNNPGAFVLTRAKEWKVPTFVCPSRNYPDKTAYELAILEVLQKHQIDFIVLAGYMRLLGPTLLAPYEGRIVNLHPSLLPAFPGKDAIGQALEHGVRISGITIHFVDEGLDTGPIIYQQAVALDPDETRQTLTAKIQQVEHQVYPEIVKACVTEQVVLEGGKVKWRKQPFNVR
ncbi:phosphoribosylglycinamide formyltransferase [Caldalkalibacillus thermarum TA2.A1]|uniref:Phosphoribosylglycinamide formyltransferase n=1 Tax=Caldalkalibacillus thermarum (strain TA2.A1) TaxID=986075 RepID=F5L5A6_CALTT|nr:phosphoribosylglycinamide formyltransferase [Caldalkalibacillus thermarum]EGL83474.1 phosphoribosylglycinamide formyltransferase [Caldalkalibacillus thermarum TA2.A1]QZT34618.1 phosphoribosylglycinamide formyltransferase [Caldalkalibacillus thermarum TA2.A1]